MAKGKWSRANGTLCQPLSAISHQPPAIVGSAALSPQPLALALAAALLVFAGGAAVRAHDIPNDVTVQVFARPEGARFRLLVRAPLQAMRDMDYPKPRDTTRGDLMDLSRAESTLRDASTLWISDFVDLYENDARLPRPQVVSVRAALQSDRSFTSYNEALAHVTGPPLPPDTEFVWSQGLLDVLFEYPIQSDRSSFSIEPRLGRLGIRTLTILRFLPPGRAVRSFEFVGEPGLVRLDPSWAQTASHFVRLGFFHLLDGAGYLPFLVCLVIPFRRVRPLIAVITAFTVAHSITLIASVFNLAPDALWFPPLVETLIAASIVYFAFENIVLAASTGTERPAAAFTGALKRRWAMTFAFGLVYGFAFAFAFRPMLQFAGAHAVTSMLSFNVGIEVGQLLVLALLVPVLGLLFRFTVAERVATVILSAIVGHTAWHWLSGTFAVLRQFRFEWPVVDAAFLASAMRWAMLAVVAVALYWLVFGVLRVARTEGPSGDALTRAADRSS